MSIGSHNFAAGGRWGGHGGASAGMGEELSEAFSFVEDEEEGGDSADGLRAVVPPPPPLDFAEFQEESSHQRVLVMRRGAVIAVTTLVSIGGAIFLHSLFAGAFVLALLFGRTPAARVWGPGSGGDAASEGGSGFMVIDSQLPGASPGRGGRDALGSGVAGESAARCSGANARASAIIAGNDRDRAGALIRWKHSPGRAVGHANAGRFRHRARDAAGAPARIPGGA